MTSQVTTSQESHLNVNFFLLLIKMRFWAEMPSGTCELSCALITNMYTICKYEYKLLNYDSSKAETFLLMNGLDMPRDEFRWVCLVAPSVYNMICSVHVDNPFYCSFLE